MITPTERLERHYRNLSTGVHALLGPKKFLRIRPKHGYLEKVGRERCLTWMDSVTGHSNLGRTPLYAHTLFFDAAGHFDFAGVHLITAHRMGPKETAALVATLVDILDTCTIVKVGESHALPQG